MVIEFKIQLDDNGGATIIPAQTNGNQNSTAQKQLSSAFSAQSTPAPTPVPKAGDGPLVGPGTGLPAGVGAPAGSGMVFVLGPIVICGSGPGHTGPGGDGPLVGPGTGKPDGGGNNATTQNDKVPPAPKVALKRSRGRK